MATIIRDINGNRTKNTLSHYVNHCSATDDWHQDSTGLFVIDYRDGNERCFVAMIRPETQKEENAVECAMKLGNKRE